MHVMKILVTGFEPFGGETVNPALEAVRKLPPVIGDHEIIPLQVPVVRSEVEDASAFGAFVMNGFARGKWTSFGQAAAVWNGEAPVLPQSGSGVEDNYKGWQAAVRQLIK